MEDKALSYTDLLSGLRYDKFTSRLYNFLFLFLCCKKIHKNKAPNVGLEPTTLRLRVSCSTD